jgi:lipopolysaccharide export system protein LptA
VRAGGIQGEAIQWGALTPALELAAGKAYAAETTLLRQETGREPLTIQAASSEWDLKAHTVHFKSAGPSAPIVVTRGLTTMTCATLDASYGEKQQIRSIVAEGNPVRVVREDRHAEARKAELLPATGELLLTGNPRIGEGENVLTGKKIWLYLDDEKVRCEGADAEPCQLVMTGDMGKP